MDDNQARWYGVSHGNGNDGVSQMHPAYIVFTNDPWLLARAAIISRFSNRRWRRLACQADIDGEAEYTIAATIYEGPDGETEFGAAAHITEVFPVDAELVERWQADPYKRTSCYSSTAAAHGPNNMRLARKYR